MMDIRCTQCGEPWDISELSNAVTRREHGIKIGKHTGEIRSCNACKPTIARLESMENKAQRRAEVREIYRLSYIAQIAAQACPFDYDGQAVMSEDMGMMSTIKNLSVAELRRVYQYGVC